MYAVVHTGGKQYRVEKGEIFRVEKLPGDIGAPVTFDRVMMLRNGEDVQIGQPILENVSVEGKILEQGKAKKILVFKYKRRKRYRRMQGHRQRYTAVRVERIIADGLDITKEDESAEVELKQKPEMEAVAAELVEKEQVETVEAASETAEETKAGEEAAPEESAADEKTETEG